MTSLRPGCGVRKRDPPVGVRRKVRTSETGRTRGAAAEINHRKCTLVPGDALDAELLIPPLELRDLLCGVVVAVHTDGEMVQQTRAHDPVVVDASGAVMNHLGRLRAFERAACSVS